MTETKITAPSPSPSSSALTATADMLAADGADVHLVRQYRDRASEAKAIEDRIWATYDQVTSLGRVAQQAISKWPDDDSPGDHPRADYSQPRGERVAEWLLASGWTPPAGFAYRPATPHERRLALGLAAASERAHELGICDSEKCGWGDHK